MRLRKENDELQDEEILLVANVSDAFAHPARVKIFRYIYMANRNRQVLCNKDVVRPLTTARPPFPSTSRSWWKLV